MKKMNNQELQEHLKSKISDGILSCMEKNPQRLYLEIEPGEIRNISSELYAILKFRFVIASAVQNLAGFQILYHFSLDETGLILSIQVKLGKDDPEVDSISDLVPAADWIEREMHELFGIRFKGRPELERLLLGEEWPEGVYPLRKGFQGLDQDNDEERMNS